MSAPHILLIEDDDTECLLATRTLNKIDPSIKITCLQNGAEFAEWISGNKQMHVDVALMDLHMPRMGGIAFLESLSKQNEKASFPIVVFSSSENSEEIRQAYEFGATAFVTKPMDQAGYRRALGNIVNFWLGTNRLT